MPIKLPLEKLSKILNLLKKPAPKSPQSNPLEQETVPALNLLSTPDIKSIFDERNLRRVIWVTYLVVIICCGTFVFFLNLNSTYNAQLAQLKNERDILLSKVRANLSLESKAYTIDHLQQQVTQLKASRVLVAPRSDHLIKSVPGDIRLVGISYESGSVTLLLDATSASAYARFIAKMLEDKSVSRVVIAAVYLDTRSKEYRASFDVIYD